MHLLPRASHHRIVSSRCAFAIALLLAASGSSHARYSVTVDPRHPLLATATLELPPSKGSGRALVLRGVEWGLTAQVSNPRCGTQALKKSGPAEWTVPPDCMKASWTVDFVAAQPGKIDASEQKSLYFPSARWWLLSEPTSLLRLQDDEAPSSLTIGFVGKPMQQMGATATGNGRWRVPPVASAPEFYVFGNLKSVERRVDGVLIRHVADDIDRVQRLGLLQAQEDAWRYLSRVTPPPAGAKPEDRELLVVWLGARDRKHAGGAAGSRSFVANYFDATDPSAQALSMAITAHEQQHQLVDMVRAGRPPLPVWVGESLATYYGLKALAGSALDPKAIESVRGRYIDASRAVTAGMVELQRRHDKGDQAAYPLFYQQGATFWALVDEALLKASKGRQGLDALLPQLLESEFEPDGQLPASFADRLQQTAGPSMQELLTRYVGS